MNYKNDLHKILHIFVVDTFFLAPPLFEIQQFEIESPNSPKPNLLDEFSTITIYISLNVFLVYFCLFVCLSVCLYVQMSNLLFSHLETMVTASVLQYILAFAMFVVTAVIGIVPLFVGQIKEFIF